jgi:hypothetical protein
MIKTGTLFGTMKGDRFTFGLVGKHRTKAFKDFLNDRWTFKDAGHVIFVMIFSDTLPSK